MTRAERISKLATTAKGYIAAEKKRISNEVSFLKDVLDGRTAGKGIQSNPISNITSAVESDLAAYLGGTQ